jgi:hypothetical protein
MSLEEQIRMVNTASFSLDGHMKLVSTPENLDEMLLNNETGMKKSLKSNTNSNETITRLLIEKQMSSKVQSEEDKFSAIKLKLNTIKEAFEDTSDDYSHAIKSSLLSLSECTPTHRFKHQLVQYDQFVLNFIKQSHVFIEK